MAREAPNGVDSRSGILQTPKELVESPFSAPKPNLEGDVLLLDPKTKFLSLTHADDTGLRESRQRMLLVLVAAVIAMITSSTASAAPPTASRLLEGLEGGRAAPSAPVARSTSPKAPSAGSRASIRGPVRSRPLPAVCRRRSSASAAPST